MDTNYIIKSEEELRKTANKLVGLVAILSKKAPIVVQEKVKIDDDLLETIVAADDFELSEILTRLQIRIEVATNELHRLC